MCVCVCVCVCVYIYIYMYKCVYIRAYISVLRTHIYVPDTFLLIAALGSLTSDIPCTNPDSCLDIHCTFFDVKK